VAGEITANRPPVQHCENHTFRKGDLPAALDRASMARRKSPSPRSAPPSPTGVLVCCSDYRCSHSVSLDADRWGDEVRLSDTEGQFCFAKRAVTAVPTRDLTGNLGNGECPRPTSRQAHKFSTVPNPSHLATMATSSPVR
jgi:hypothetical protein